MYGCCCVSVFSVILLIVACCSPRRDMYRGNFLDKVEVLFVMGTCTNTYLRVVLCVVDSDFVRGFFPESLCPPQETFSSCIYIVFLVFMCGFHESVFRCSFLLTWCIYKQCHRTDRNSLSGWRARETRETGGVRVRRVDVCVRVRVRVRVCTTTLK